MMLVREERKGENYRVGGLYYFCQQDGRWSQDPLECRHIFTRLNVVTMFVLW